MNTNRKILGEFGLKNGKEPTLRLAFIEDEHMHGDTTVVDWDGLTVFDHDVTGCIMVGTTRIVISDSNGREIWVAR